MRTLIISLGLVAVTAVPAAVAAAGDPAAGLTLAQTWCTGCHLVAPSGPGRDTAPSFMTIAERPNLSAGGLRAWLTAPHPPMPNLSLSRQQIDDILAYLQSLKAR